MSTKQQRNKIIESNLVAYRYWLDNDTGDLCVSKSPYEVAPDGNAFIKVYIDKLDMAIVPTSEVGKVYRGRLVMIKRDDAKAKKLLGAYLDEKIAEAKATQKNYELRKKNLSKKITVKENKFYN